MSKRKIIYNRSLPNHKQIEEQKDFEGVLKRYDAASQKLPSYRNRNYFLGLSLIAIIAYLVYIESAPPKEVEQTNDHHITDTLNSDTSKP